MSEVYYLNTFKAQTQFLSKLFDTLIVSKENRMTQSLFLSLHCCLHH